MITEIMQIRVLMPSENHFLLNENEKVISEKVFLGKEASTDDWREITKTEKETFEKEWENEIKKMNNNAI